MKLCEALGADVAIDYTAEDFKKIVLEETKLRGVDVVFDNVGEAVMDASKACIAYNGRYLTMGFASGKRFADEKLIVPRRLATGNFKLCGVMLGYANAQLGPMLKQAVGWNLAPDSLGQKAMAEILALVRADKLRPVIGEVVGFTGLPAAMTRMRDRRTTGRVIVTVD